MFIYFWLLLGRLFSHLLSLMCWLFDQSAFYFFFSFLVLYLSLFLFLFPHLLLFFFLSFPISCPFFFFSCLFFISFPLFFLCLFLSSISSFLPYSVILPFLLPSFFLHSFRCSFYPLFIHFFSLRSILSSMSMLLFSSSSSFTYLLQLLYLPRCIQFSSLPFLC